MCQLSTLFIDTPYALVYGFVYSFILLKLLKKNKLWSYKLVAFIPFLASLADLLENTGLVLILLNYPLRLEVVVQFTSFFNQSKWFFAVIVLLLIVGNLLWMVFQKYKQK